jgi:hypothetical protein
LTALTLSDLWHAVTVGNSAEMMAETARTRRGDIDAVETNGAVLMIGEHRLHAVVAWSRPSLGGLLGLPT